MVIFSEAVEVEEEWVVGFNGKTRKSSEWSRLYNAMCVVCCINRADRLLSSNKSQFCYVMR
jgi:hypothetical protein